MLGGTGTGASGGTDMSVCDPGFGAVTGGLTTVGGAESLPSSASVLLPRITGCFGAAMTGLSSFTVSEADRKWAVVVLAWNDGSAVLGITNPLSTESTDGCVSSTCLGSTLPISKED